MKTESAKCANHIKRLLKKAFPTVRFSVTSDNFSMGDSVRISWNLGPTEKRVRKIVGEFQYGHFDGMTDMYEHSNTRNDIPQAKYVSCNRKYMTEEEIRNSRLGWNDPERRDLWKEERTLYHVIGRDLCGMMGVAYEGMYMTIPDDFRHMVRGCCGYYVSLQNLVNALLYDIDLMEGYHGVRKKVWEETGEEIINSFELY